MKPPPLKIGNLIVDPPVVLAPMAGYTDAAFRSLCHQYKCPLTYTEVTNSEGITRGVKSSIHMLETFPDERPIGAHIYGANPDILANAAALIEKMNRFDLIDINCGCPVPKIVAKGAGAALMRSPEKIEQIVRAVKSAVTLPVTVKTRIGLAPDRMNISEIAHAVESAGASAIAIHARFASRRHSGEADWETLARIKSERSIPVIGNGGISKAQDVPRMLAATGVDAVMIGRAAVGNPWLFDEINALFNDLPYTPHSLAEHRAVIMTHLEQLTVLKHMENKYRKKNLMSAANGASLHFRAHLYRYMSGFRGWARVRLRLQTMHTIDDIKAAVDSMITEQAE